MKPWLSFIFFSLALCAFADRLTEAEKQLIADELAAPITLNLENRQSITGNPTQIGENQIQIASAEGAGEIVFTFDYEQIKSIEVPGESYKSLALELLGAGDEARALDLMDLLYQQRKALLPILPPGESNFFVLYIPLILDSPDPARAIGVGARLRPQITNPTALQALDEVILESYQRLELFDEAVPLARASIEKEAAHNGKAFGYYVLGSDYLRKADYEQALDLALQPIVFSSLLAGEKLAYCYALAISAALELRESDYAKFLFREMQERGFKWPDNDSTLQPYLKKIHQHIADHEVD